MKKKVFSVFFIVLTLQLLTSNIYATYGEPDLFVKKYNEAKYMQRMMQDKLNWAIKIIGEKGDKAFPVIENFNKTSGTDLFVWDPLAEKMVISPEYVSVVKGTLNLNDVNPKFYTKKIIQAAIKELSSGNIDKLINIMKPFDFEEHLGRIALTPKGKIYIVATGIKNIALAKEFIVHIVNSACILMKNNGIETAFKEFNREGSEFRERNTYVYVITDKGDFLVDPNYPEIVGKNMLNFPGNENTYPIKKLIESVSKRPYSLWIYTKSLKPTDDLDAKNRIDLDKAGKALKEKLSFVRKITIDGKVYIVGSGVYVDKE